MRKRELDWEAIDPLLGTASDKKIAAMCKVSVTPIRSRRIALGIRAYAQGQERDWASIDPLLKAGVVSIKNISLKFNIHSPTLNDRRRKLGIIPPKPEPPCWAEIDPLLGTAPDVRLALKFNMPKTAVANRRKQLGIPACLEWNIIDWSEVDPYLGTCIDREIAERAGVSVARVAQRRRRLGIPPFSGRSGSKERIDWKAIEPYLGTATDIQLADHFNVSSTSISRKRLDMGIKAYKQPWNWRKNKRIFNTMSNMEIAKKYKISTSAAASARAKLGMSAPRKDHSFIDRYLDVLNDAEIAEKLGIEKRIVCNRRYHVTKRKRTMITTHANNTRPEGASTI